MSIDVLQNKIRKSKSPVVLQLDGLMQTVPAQFLDKNDDCVAYLQYASALLESLREHLCAVRLSFSGFAFLGAGGLSVLSELIRRAKTLDYYVVLDLPELNSAHGAQMIADKLRDEESAYNCDGYILSSYAGSDVIKPFADLCKNGKSLFCIVRTANRSATEIQDLLTGSRLVHTAVSDVVNRYAETSPAACGYSNIGVLAAASSADSVRNLRGKYKRLFLLLDGYDYPNSNAKNCSYAFDSLGHGAAVCAGLSITGAWKENGTDGFAFAEEAVRAVQQIKKNLNRYISIL